MASTAQVLGRLDPVELVNIDRAAASCLRGEARRLVNVPGESSAELAERAAGLAGALPAPLLRALHRYSNVGTPHNVLLVRGLLPDVADLQPTPATATPARLDRAAQAAALSLLAVLSPLGEAFTFASLYQGRLVQHVTPVPGREDAQTSEGSATDLAWHVEDAFTEQRCDFFGLLCLRGDRGAATRVAPARSLRLPGPVERVLREPRFVVEPDFAHGVMTGGTLSAVSVLSGPRRDPEIRFDAVYQRPADPDDGEAAAALAALAEAIDSAAVGHVLSPGQLLIVDNRRVAHGRTLFPARYDGTDRWLLRTMVCASRRAHRRRDAARALR